MKDRETLTPFLQQEVDLFIMDDEGPFGLCDRMVLMVPDATLVTRMMTAMAVGGAFDTCRCLRRVVKRERTFAC